MNIQLHGQVTTFGALARGARFRDAAGDWEFFGSESLEGRPEAQMRFGMRDKDDHKPLIVAGAPNLCSTVFAPDGTTVRCSFEDLRLSASAHTSVGDLVISAEDTHLCAENGSTHCYVNLCSGEVVDRLAATVAIAKRWSIVQVIDGKPETILEYAIEHSAQTAASRST
jgi:hypothetical protein